MKRQVYIITKTKNTGNSLTSNNLYLDCREHNTNSKSRSSAADFLEFKEQNGERTKNKVKLKTSFIYVYNSELARIKDVYLILCIFFY